jgi:DNA-directed RNA polymerase II subunit RPB2
MNRKQQDDRDSFINKRIALPGNLLEDQFRQHWKRMIIECNKIFSKKNTNHQTPLNIINQIKPSIILQGLKTALIQGTWGKHKGVSQLLQRMSYNQTVESLRKIETPDITESHKLTNPRHYHSSQIGFICPIETPDGSQVGIVKQLTLIASVTLKNDTLYDIIKEKLVNQVIRFHQMTPYHLKNFTKVFLNGNWLGVVEDGLKLYHFMKKQKLYANIDRYTSIVFNYNDNEIKICCDGGRLYRPILRVENNRLLIQSEQIQQYLNEKNLKSWEEFLLKNPEAIEYMDVDEQEFAMIAPSFDYVDDMHSKMKHSESLPITDVVNRYDESMFVRYTHCEFHPTLLMGVIATSIPFSNHNQGPRNTFQYALGKQAMGTYATDYRHRTDISNILTYPEIPIVQTRTAPFVNDNLLAAGQNLVVAIMCYSGYNQDDSIIMNQASAERGVGVSTLYKKSIVEAQKNQSTAPEEKITRPDPSKVMGMRNVSSYSKLNEDGFIPEETKIVNGDVTIGKITPIQPVGNNTKMYKDSSEVYKSHEAAVVDKIYDVEDQDGNRVLKMRYRSKRIPRCGDKFSSRHSQKGTVGMIMTSSDMPFTGEGISPDIIVNPNAIPSRMTVAHLIECIVGKTAAIQGKQADGTAYNRIDIKEISRELKKLGYREDGTEYLYNGMTGEKIKVAIFIGPTYYQRLKHLVMDKIHSRARGSNTLLTRQPLEGRSREGGFRIGEMEKDAILAHGMTRFLNERFMKTSDEYTAYVCNMCGLFAQREIKKNSQSYLTENDIYYCQPCNNYSKISKVKIPYAFKLLTQELMSMNIVPRIRCKVE